MLSPVQLTIFWANRGTSELGGYRIWMIWNLWSCSASKLLLLVRAPSSLLACSYPPSSYPYFSHYFSSAICPVLYYVDSLHSLLSCSIPCQFSSSALAFLTLSFYQPPFFLPPAPYFSFPSLTGHRSRALVSLGSHHLYQRLGPSLAFTRNYCLKDSAWLLQRNRLSINTLLRESRG